MLIESWMANTVKKIWEYHSFYDTAPRSYDPLFKTISVKEAGKLLPSF